MQHHQIEVVACMTSVTAATELVILHGIVPMTAPMVSVAPGEEREGVGAAVEGEVDDMGLAAEADLDPDPPEDEDLTPEVAAEVGTGGDPDQQVEIDEGVVQGVHQNPAVAPGPSVVQRVDHQSTRAGMPRQARDPAARPLTTSSDLVCVDGGVRHRASSFILHKHSSCSVFWHFINEIISPF